MATRIKCFSNSLFDVYLFNLVQNFLVFVMSFCCFLGDFSYNQVPRFENIPWIKVRTVMSTRRNLLPNNSSWIGQIVSIIMSNFILIQFFLHLFDVSLKIGTFIFLIIICLLAILEHFQHDNYCKNLPNWRWFRIFLMITAICKAYWFSVSLFAWYVTWWFYRPYPWTEEPWLGSKNFSQNALFILKQ